MRLLLRGDLLLLVGVLSILDLEFDCLLLVGVSGLAVGGRPIEGVVESVLNSDFFCLFIGRFGHAISGTVAHFSLS